MYATTKTLIATFLLSSTFSALSQNVLIADNNFNAPAGVYSTLQEASDAATAGDTIYVQPSPTKYGDVTIEKEIHLVGIGFALDKDLPHQSQIEDVFLWNNVDNTSNASNSTVSGLQADNIYMVNRDGITDFTLDNVTISNCLMVNITYLNTGRAVPVSNFTLYGSRVTSDILFSDPCTNVIIRNNLLQRNLYFNSTSPQTIIISNNIIYGLIDKNSVGDNMIIQNNNFVGTKGSSRAFDVMLDATIANNIFYGNTPSDVAAGNSTDVNFQRNVFSNNLSYETGADLLPADGGGVGNSGDGNIESTSPLLTDVPILNTWSASYDYTLQVGSPALDAGTNGTDIGISGGPYPFPNTNLLLKTTSLPTIQSLNVNAVINPGDDLNVRIKAKSN